MSEAIGTWAGFVLTLMVFSYLLGDNVLYRLAVYVFVGLSAGYITLVTIDSVIVPWFQQTVFAPTLDPGALIIGLIPLILALLLILKGTVRFGRAGNIALAFIIGVGVAVTLVGAAAGTIIPLARSIGGGVRIDPLNGFLIFVGVAGTLLYFQYLARRTEGGGTQRTLLGRALGAAGQVVIVITLGAVYAGAILTSLTAFSERIGFILARITGG